MQKCPRPHCDASMQQLISAPLERGSTAQFVTVQCLYGYFTLVQDQIDLNEKNVINH